MSYKKQTAVEWLYKQLNGLNKQILDDYFQIVFSQAKEMEKQQIIDARNDGFNISGEGWNGEYGVRNFDEEVNSKQYYNETYETK
jgi:hypothetical protein